MAFCGNCGIKLIDIVNFCPQCGAKLATNCINETAQIQVQKSQSQNIVQQSEKLSHKIPVSVPKQSNWKPIIAIIAIAATIGIVAITIRKNINEYKPITLSKEDFQNMDINRINDSNLMEQFLVLQQLEKGGDAYFMACTADYENKKRYISRTSPWGIYYKKIEKNVYDILIDMTKFMNLLQTIYQ